MAVVGPGRAGTVVAAGLARGGHRIVAVVGGTTASRDRFRKRLPTARPAELADLAGPARADVAPELGGARPDLVVLAVPDGALGGVVAALARVGRGDGRLVVHLSGANGTEVLGPLRTAGWRVAATHPVVTFPDPMAHVDTLVGMPWGVTADDGERGLAREVALATGGEPIDVAERGPGHLPRWARDRLERSGRGRRRGGGRAGHRGGP